MSLPTPVSNVEKLQGPVVQVYRAVRRYVERRFRKWLMRREQRGGTGYKQYPDAYLYEELGLFPIPGRRAAAPNVKV